MGKYDIICNSMYENEKQKFEQQKVIRNIVIELNKEQYERIVNKNNEYVIRIKKDGKDERSTYSLIFIKNLFDGNVVCEFKRIGYSIPKFTYEDYTEALRKIILN